MFVKNKRILVFILATFLSLKANSTSTDYAVMCGQDGTIEEFSMGESKHQSYLEWSQTTNISETTDTKNNNDPDLMINSLMNNDQINAIITEKQRQLKKEVKSIFCLEQGAGKHTIEKIDSGANSIAIPCKALTLIIKPVLARNACGRLSRPLKKKNILKTNLIVKKYVASFLNPKICKN